MERQKYCPWCGERIRYNRLSAGDGVTLVGEQKHVCVFTNPIERIDKIEQRLDEIERKIT